MRLLISRHLENYLAIYDALNMHVAAERKGISQPALTKSLKLLEQEVGAELFLRTSKGLEPTDAGHILYQHAREIEREARFASLELTDLFQAMRGTIRIGVGKIFAEGPFSQVLLQFHKQFPNVSVSVESGISDYLVQELIDEKLDLVIAAGIQSAFPERFVSVPLFSSDMIVICRQDHPLITRQPASIAEVAQFHRVGFVDDFEFEKQARRSFGKLAPKLEPVMQSTSLSIIFDLLAATDFYAIVSEEILTVAQRSGLAHVNLPEKLWELNVELMCKSTLVNSHPIRFIKSALIEKKRLTSQ